MHDTPTPPAPRETIVVLDFGSQYAQLITRRVRECQVYCEMLPWAAPPEALDALHPRGIILSGGPCSVYDRGAPHLARHVLARGVPVLGICYGMQLLAHSLGGAVSPSASREYGPAEVTLADDPGALLNGLPSPLPVWMSHGDRIERLPDGFGAVARSPHSPVAAMVDEGRRLYGLQFHPEVAARGIESLRRFVVDVCGCAPDWTPGSFIDETVAAIRETVGAGRVVCGVSGGVDSTVAAALVHRAVGEQLTAVYVDTGMMRKDESAEAMGLLRGLLGGSVLPVNATERFLEALEGVTDPEEKRKTIGRVFVEVFDEEAARLGRVDFLARDIYPTSSSPPRRSQAGATAAARSRRTTTSAACRSTAHAAHEPGH